MITKKRILYFVSIILVVVLGSIIYIGNKNTVGSYEDELSKADYQQSIDAIENYMDSYQKESSYYSIKKQWEADEVPIPNHSYTIMVPQIKGGEVYAESQSEGYGQAVVYVKPKDQISFDVEVTDEGLYEIWLDYYILKNTYLKPELDVDVNQKNQFNEMNDLKLAMDWETLKLDSAQQYDRYGDELTPKSTLVSKWKSEGLVDPNYFFEEPLKFKLNKGKSTISVSLEEGYLLLGNIQVRNTASSLPVYAAYMEQQLAHNAASQTLLTIEAEDISIKSRQSIRTKYFRDPQVTPYAYKHRVMNVLDGYSFGDSGDEVEYRFSVEKSGLYQLSFKYSQDTNNGMSTHRKIEIDGKVPFQELAHYIFDYSSGWSNHTLQDVDGDAYRSTWSKVNTLLLCPLIIPR
jgi:hypothetical protein